MSKRISPESRVVDFFTNAPFAKVETVFNIIAPVVKLRRNAAPDVAASPNPAKRKPRKKRQAELPLGEGA